MLFTDIQERHRFSYFQTEKYKTEFTDPFSIKKETEEKSKRVANFIYMVPHSCKKKKLCSLLSNVHGFQHEKKKLRDGRCYLKQHNEPDNNKEHFKVMFFFFKCLEERVNVKRTPSTDL